MSLVLLIAMSGLLVGSIHMGSPDVRGRMRQGIPGAPVEWGSSVEYFTGLNKSPQAVQVSTVAVTDPGDNTVVTITINGTAVSINTGAVSADATSIAAQLATAINANGLVRSRVAATSAAAVLTLTGLVMGTDGAFTVANTTAASLAAATLVTTAASAAAIPFGRAVFAQGFQTGEGEPYVALAAAGGFTPQVITSTIAFVSGAVLTVEVYERRGAFRTLLTSQNDAMATSADASLDAMAVLLNAALAANTVLVASAPATATGLVFTAEVPGTEIEVYVTAGSEGASVPAITTVETTGPSPATSFERAFAGMSMHNIDSPAVGSLQGEYAGNAGVLVMRKGLMFVASAEVITQGATVYVETGVTADNGKLFIAGSATRIALPRSRILWERDGNLAADGIAIVRLAA